jgi:hypothetical protein
VKYDPGDLLRFAGFIHDTTDQLGLGYIDDHAEVIRLSHGIRWQDSLVKKHDQVYRDVNSAISRLHSGLASTAHQIRDVNAWYLKVEDEQIQEIEKAISDGLGGAEPHLPSANDIRKDHPGSTTDPRWKSTRNGYPAEPNPARHLIVRDVHAAAEADDPGDPLKLAGDILDLLSISSWIEKAIEEVAGVKLSSWVAEVAYADWHQFFKLAKVWGQVGNALWDAGDKLQRGNRWNSLYWEGPAADAAHIRLDEFRDALRDASRTLNRLEEAYTSQARSLYQLTSLAADMSKALVDICIEGALGIGLLVARAGRTAKEIKALVDKLGTTMAGLRGSAATFEALLASANGDIDDLFKQIPEPLEYRGVPSR